MEDIVIKLTRMLGESVDEAAITKYKKRRVKHGKRRSTAGRLQGANKRKYLKSLKTKKKKYKASAAMRSKTSRKRKKYVKTSGAKKAKRMYKGKR